MNTPMTADEMAAHFDRKKRRAMTRMAAATGLSPVRFAEVAGVNLAQYDLGDPSAATAAWDAIARQLSPEAMLRLWNEVSEAIAGGVPSTSTTFADDPWCIALTGICDGGDDHHGGKGQYKQTAVHKTPGKLDQAEAEEVLAFLKKQPQLNLCEMCERKITTWQADNTRVSVLRARENQGQPMASLIRGSEA